MSPLSLNSLSVRYCLCVLLICISLYVFFLSDSTLSPRLRFLPKAHPGLPLYFRAFVLGLCGPHPSRVYHGYLSLDIYWIAVFSSLVKIYSEMRRRGDDTVASKPTEEKSMKSEKQLISRSFWRDWVKWGLIALCTLFVTTSYVQRICPGFTQYLFYQHGLSFFVDLRHPTDLGLNHTVNMYLTSEAEVTLGVWHTVPDHIWKEAQGKSLAWYEQSLGNGSPVFIYYHGNAGNRASPPHRLGVSKILSALGYHVLVMDYRGFGDSTGEPTMPGLVTDALYLYHWVRARSKGSQVFIWGHSIGTGVTTSAVVKLQEQGSPPDAVILEGSFLDSKVPKGVPHLFLWYYWRFPYIQYYFSQDAIKANKVQVSNSENVKQMRTPLMILHSKDDHLTPIRMAEELYKTAKSVLPEEKVRLVAFEAFHGYRHNGLYRDPRLPKIIREFVQSNAK